ncbi:uncharacterized protein LOC144825247 isoform X2 [Lissotriton helveticus]
METSAAMMILDSFSNLFVEFTLSALLTICLFLEEEIQLTSFNNNMRRKEQSLYTSVETGGLEEAYLCGLEIEMEAVSSAKRNIHAQVHSCSQDRQCEKNAGERSHKPTGVMWTALYCSRCNLMNPPSHSNEEEGTYSRKSEAPEEGTGVPKCIGPPSSIVVLLIKNIVECKHACES